MNLLNLSDSTWQYICTALIAVAITSCVIGVWRDNRRERRQAPRLTGSRLTRVLAAHDQAEQALRDHGGDAPHCPDCLITWDNDGDRCGLIPCDQHKPEHVGRHRSVWQGSLDDQPADVILAVITEVQNRKKP